ncbi:MAG: hypothetical protein WC371_02450 [Parachlamydiales bacterium]
MNGFFTEELIRSLGSSCRFSFASESSRKLVVSIVEEKNDPIGYRYDRELSGALKKSLLPTEGRQKLRLQISLCEKGVREAFFGPFEITEDIDFDFVEEDSLGDLSFVDGAGTRKSVLAFSLGQLESINAAQEAAKRVLYRKAARRIIEILDAKYPITP